MGRRVVENLIDPQGPPFKRSLFSGLHELKHILTLNQILNLS